MRMEDNDIPKKIFSLQPEEKRAVGRLRVDGGEQNDARALGIMNWWTTAQDQDRWHQLLWKSAD